MKKILILVAVAAALVVAVPASANTVNVAITTAGFVPRSPQIQTNDTVTWTNSDTTNHQVISQQGGFASPVLKPGDSWSYTFSKPGNFSYRDAYDKNSSGVVTVKAAAVSVSMALSRDLVVYGGKLTASGKVSDGQSGENVDLYAVPCGKSTQSAQKVASTTTTNGGDYSLLAQPLLQTQYSVQVNGSSSNTATVNVAPRLHLGKVAPRRFTISVRAAQSFAGHSVAVQRWTGLNWKFLRSAVLRPGANAIDPTVLSAVTFTAKVHPRTKLRVVMTKAQTGSCYAPGLSNAIVA